MAQKVHDIGRYSYDFDPRTGGPRLLQLWSKTALIADVHFVPDNVPLPAPHISPNLDWAVTHFRWSSFLPIIDMLRNEKPVRVQINNDQSPGFVFIGTFLEPVGEAEM
jgi:hypothetical protein